MCVEGKAEGKGRCVFLNGDVYFGEWKNDKRNGIFQYIFFYFLF
jgi:hypothetical protein